MAQQLTLLETPPSWRLDEPTREAGRRGVAEARASLRAALAGRDDDSTATAGDGTGEHPSHGRSAA